MYSAARAQKLAGGVDINVLPSLPTEVGTRESSILSFAYVSDGDVRRDPAPDEPAEEASSSIPSPHVAEQL